MAFPGDGQHSSLSVHLSSEQLNAAVALLTRRFTVDGHRHPHAAAVTVSVRGLAGVDVDAFAQKLGLDRDRLAAVEAGAVATGDVPRVLVDVAASAGLSF